MLIRHKAYTKLAAVPPNQQSAPPIDGALLWDVTNTLMQPSTSPDLYRPYSSRAQAALVEERMAAAIAAAYTRIKQQAARPLVQQLNRLL